MNEAMIQKMVQDQLRAMLADETVKAMFEDVQTEPEPKVVLSDVLGFYDPNDSWTLDLISAETPCFATYKKSDPICGDCDLASRCDQARKDRIEEGKKRRGALSDILDNLGLSKDVVEGYKDAFKRADMSATQTKLLFHDTVCALSGMSLNAHAPGTLVPGIGLVLPELAEYAQIKGW